MSQLTTLQERLLMSESSHAVSSDEVDEKIDANCL
jgi:hypothetical protein